MSPYQSSPPELWPGILEGVPNEFKSVLSEPAMMMSDTTFAIWRRYSDAGWQRSSNVTFPDNRYGDGSEEMLWLLDGSPELYADWAVENYELEDPPDLTEISRVYQHQPIDDRLVRSLNPKTRLKAIKHHLMKIGYPTQT